MTAAQPAHIYAAGVASFKPPGEKLAGYRIIMSNQRQRTNHAAPVTQSRNPPRPLADRPSAPAYNGLSSSELRRLVAEILG